ncbi:MAG: RecX family transcriptional regulator [Bacteroidales bacterium]|nr:RecX family transcriptional regulator [Bacteroidales bacterium]
MITKKSISVKQALVKVQNLCARSEKCKADIRKKLYEWQISSSESEKIIESLVQDKFIDELRYAEYFVRDKFRFNKWGRIKIAYTLKLKQIPQNIIEQALLEIKEEEYRESIKNEIMKKQKNIKDTETYKLKEKLIRFAQSRCYELDISSDIIEKITTEN